jgi:type VI secretion system protein ImpH
MGAESGEAATPLRLGRVERELRSRATAFEFVQLVRLIERLLPDRSPVGHFGDPAAESAHFSVQPSISFPPGEIAAFEWRDGEPAPRIEVNFFGLTGPQGVLPYHYTLLLAERRRARDRAPGEFLDLFQHRLLSLFYRVWRKYRFTIAQEDGGADPLAAHLLELAGLNPVAESNAELTRYVGLMAPQQRSAVALEELIEDYFGVPVEVEQFVGGWQRLPRRDQCALGEEEGAAGQLGLGAVAGDEVWDCQSRVRLRIGPLARDRFGDFLPTGSAYFPLRRLVRLFGRDQFEFEVQLVLEREEVPGFRLGIEGEVQPLGWGTWLRTGEFGRDADDTIFRL